ncbi:hypothetical protein BLOT_008806, partial [Blomia tropicalis]
KATQFCLQSCFYCVMYSYGQIWFRKASKRKVKMILTPYPNVLLDITLLFQIMYNFVNLNLHGKLLTCLTVSKFSKNFQW